MRGSPESATIGGMVFAVLAGGWVLCSILTAAVCSTVARGGVAEDRARGYLSDQI